MGLFLIWGFFPHEDFGLSNFAQWLCQWDFDAIFQTFSIERISLSIDSFYILFALMNGLKVIDYINAWFITIFASEID